MVDPLSPGMLLPHVPQGTRSEGEQEEGERQKENKDEGEEKEIEDKDMDVGESANKKAETVAAAGSSDQPSNREEVADSAKLQRKDSSRTGRGREAGTSNSTLMSGDNKVTRSTEAIQQRKDLGTGQVTNGTETQPLTSTETDMSSEDEKSITSQTNNGTQAAAKGKKRTASDASSENKRKRWCSAACCLF